MISKLQALARPTRQWILRSILSLLLFVLAGAIPVQAAEISISASLSQNTMTAGDSVDLIITAQGKGRIDSLPQVTVRDLEIVYRGESQQTRIENGKLSTSLQLNFVISGDKPGVYTIPAIPIQANGQTFSTQPLQLTIEADGSGTKTNKPDAVGFAEITVAKKSAYIGETIPVELRVYRNPRIPSEIENMPTIEGEGFTKQKIPNPRREQGRRDGMDYEVDVFRTAITPSKAGKISFGPAEINLRAQLPQTRRNRSRSTLDDFFNFSTVEVKRVHMNADAVELDVRPLPIVGRPKDFSGAVGNFDFSAEASPLKLKVGDPITMKLKISGRGNFDRLNAPAITDAAGWHSYPPTNEFKADDDLGVSGTKSFEMAVIPETHKTSAPQFSFSFFNPISEKYVTAQSQPIPIEVEGTPLVTEAPPATPQQQSAAPTPAPEKKPTSTEIVGLRYEFGAAHDSIAPLYSRRSFWLYQLAPLALIALLFGRNLWRPDSSRSTVAAMRQEKAQLRRRLSSEQSRAEFYEIAARIVQLEVALATGGSADSVDSAAVRTMNGIDDSTQSGIDSFFEHRAELLYAGSSVRTSSESVSDQERNRALATLDKLEKSHAK